MPNYYANWTHPHNTTNVKDESSATVATTRVLPLHRPHFPIFAAKGPANTIDWYTGTEAINTFGEATFQRTSSYWGLEQNFLTGAVFPNQGCFLTRLVDPAAKKSSAVLIMIVIKNMPLVQYERNEDGSYKLDEKGAKIPKKKEDNQNVTEKGISVTWKLRPLEDKETIDSVKKTTSSVSGPDNLELCEYPIMAVEYDSAGSWGDRSCFKFFCDYRDQDNDIVVNQNALIYTFAPAEKPYLSDTPDYIGTVYDATSAQFVLKPEAYDHDTSRYVSVKETMDRLYTAEGSNKNLLPYTVYFYEDNIKDVSDLVVELETTKPNGKGVKEKADSVPELADSPYMVNICSFVDTKGNEYPHVDAARSSITLDSYNYHYLSGGSDGDTSREKLEELYRSFLDFKVYPELQDRLRYPITHIYDVGYSVDTKNAQADFVAGMPNIKATLGVQDASKPMYDMDAAISAGSALRTRALLTPESELYGTQACRAEIMIQSGYLNDKNIKELVPFTYWLCLKRSTLQNSTFYKGDIGPDPNNRVTEFREFNFIPYSMEQKEICFKNALNYCEYGRMDRLFFASVQSVYKNKTSLLADVWFTDAIIDLKYIIDWTWADTVNASLSTAALSQLVTTKIRSQAATAFGSMFTLTECQLYQTAEEALLGTTFHIRTVLQGNSRNHIWNSDIIVRRPNLNEDGTAAV